MRWQFSIVVLLTVVAALVVVGFRSTNSQLHTIRQELDAANAELRSLREELEDLDQDISDVNAQLNEEDSPRPLDWSGFDREYRDADKAEAQIDYSELDSARPSD